jgi:hypothetical protein
MCITALLVPVNEEHLQSAVVQTQQDSWAEGITNNKNFSF